LNADAAEKNFFVSEFWHEFCINYINKVIIHVTIWGDKKEEVIE